jgi:dipeptidyl aminopeptidase/acylaminoacyl peptidase
LALISGIKTYAQPKHPVTIEDLSTLKDVDDVRLSLDGKWVAYTASDTLWLMRTLPNSASRKIGPGTQPVWSPDSKSIAYYSGRSGNTQLWVFNPRTGRSKQATHFKKGINTNTWTGYIGMRGGPQYALAYSWSPDSSRLVFPSQTPIEQKFADLANAKLGSPLILDDQTPPSWTLSGIFRSGGFGAPSVVNGKIEWKRTSPIDPPPVTQNNLYVVQVDTATTKTLTNTKEAYFNPDWSPDGGQIVCVSNEGHLLVGLGSGPTNLYLIDASTGRKARLTSTDSYKRVPRWSPDGKWIAYLEQDASYHQSLSIIPASGGQPSDLTAGLDREVDDFLWSANSDSLIINYADGPSWPVARVKLSTRDVRSLTSGFAYRSSITVSRTGAIAWKQSDALGQGKIYLLPSGSTSSYVLKDVNPQIANWMLGLQEIVHWTNSRGQELEGILIKPPGYKDDQKYPLIVDCYPGLANGFKGWAMIGNQAWAAEGYLVFWPAARAPNEWQKPYKSPSFSAEAKGPKGIDVMFDDIMSGVEMLLRNGVADPETVGLYGFSNGGGIVNQLIRRTSRFKCAVTVEPGGLTDLTADFFFYTYNKILVTNAGALPWEDPQAYIELSSVFHLDKVNTPLLLVDGDNDGMFLLNSIELYNGLRWLRKDVTFLRYPDQGHGFSGAALMDFSQRVIGFFDEHLRRGKRISSTNCCHQQSGSSKQSE